MDEKKKNSYLIMCIVLSIIICLLLCYILIIDKTKECNCIEFDKTNDSITNEIIDKNNDNGENEIMDSNKIPDSTNDVWKREKFDCKEKEDNRCLLNNTNNKIELYRGDNEYSISDIVINDNEYKFNVNEGIYNVIETTDDTVFVSYANENTDNFILFDNKANVITNFKEYYETIYSNSVKYNDGIFIVSSYPKGIAYAVAYCETMSENDVFEIKKEYKYVNNKLEIINKKEISLIEVIQREKESSGYNNCEQYLNQR